jgi:hypothetical protein
MNSIAGLLDGYTPEHEFAAELKVTTHTLRNWRRQKKGPPYVILPGRQVAYHNQGSKEWLEGRVVRGK